MEPGIEANGSMDRCEEAQEHLRRQMLYNVKRISFFPGDGSRSENILETTMLPQDFIGNLLGQLNITELYTSPFNPL